MAKKYYLEFKKQLEEKHKNLSIATIYSFVENEEDTSEGNGFQDHYKDLSDRVKKREVDLLIVVNMFLTGFDATTLNTLWVDKNLKQHGLIQAYSRTNRILNSVKSYEDYYYGYEDEKGKKQKGYEERIADLLQKYPLGEQIIGEQAQKDFIVILRLKNILSSFDRFEENEILSERDFQDYIGTYTDLYEEFKSKKDNGEVESIKDDVVFEMELVKQVEVNIDYILMLVAKYHQSNCTDKEILGSIDKAIKSSLTLRSKKELIETFISKINTNTDVMNDWTKFVKEQEEIDLRNLIEEENLNDEETRKFIDNAFRDGQVKTTGTDIEKILPPMRRFGGGNRAERKESIIEKIRKFFEKYFETWNSEELGRIKIR